MGLKTSASPPTATSASSQPPPGFERAASLAPSAPDSRKPAKTERPAAAKPTTMAPPGFPAPARVTPEAREGPWESAGPGVEGDRPAIPQGGGESAPAGVDLLASLGLGDADNSLER